MYYPGNRIRFIVFIISAIAVALQAQILSIRTYNVQQGLAQSQVNTIIQDSLGYMWFGTADGLSRFDGQSFRNFTRWDGLAGNDINCSIMPNDSLILFGHSQTGITKYYVYEKRFEILRLKFPQHGQRILQIFQDDKENLWLAISGLGLVKIRGSEQRLFTIDDGLPSKDVRGIAQDDNGYLWLATDSGLVKFSDSEQGKINFTVVGRKYGVFDTDLTSILKDRQGQLWVGSRNSGLYCFNPLAAVAQDKPAKNYSVKDGLADNWVWTIYENRRGNIVAGTFAGVSMFWHPLHGQKKGRFSSITVKNGLSYNLVVSMYQDREYNLWFGTWGGGVCQYISNAFETYTVAEGLPDKSVWNFIEDHKGNIWLATENGVAKFFEGKIAKANRHKYYSTQNGLPVNFVSNLMEDNRGYIWFGTYGGGAARLNPATDDFSIFSAKQGLDSKYIVDFFQDVNGDIWTATLDKGLFLFDKKSRRFKHLSGETTLVGNTVYSIFQDREKNLWFATEGRGVVQFDGKKYSAHIPREDLNIRSFRVVAQDTSGAMWFGSIGGGIYRYTEGRCIAYNTQNGLSGDNIFSLFCDKNNQVWIGTKNGVDRFNLQDSTFFHFGTDQGFLGIEAIQNATLEDSHGDLWFGTINGAVKFRPDKYKRNRTPPKVDLQSVLLFFKPDSLSEDGIYPYNKNHLTFNYNALSFTNPNQIRYQFKLDGFDEHWQSEISENTVTYSNLAPGKYLFKVRAKNEQGLWSKEAASYSFIIEQPFWLAWWFYVFILLLIALIIFYLHRRRLNRVEIQRDHLEKEVKKQTRELRTEKEKVEQAYSALQESEANFRSLTETAASAIFIYQGEKFVYVNPETERLTGYSKEELLNMEFWQVVHPDYQDLIKKRGMARQEGKPIPNHYEFKLLTKEGMESWIDFTAGKIEYRGKSAGLGTAFDITERKKMEQAIKDNEAQLRALINSMPDIVRFKDGQGRWLASNRFDLNFFGIENVDYVGKNNVDIAAYAPFYQDALIKCEDSDEEAWRKGTVTRSEETIKRPDGAQKIFDVIKVPLFYEDGRRKGLVIIGRDITERKKAELALRTEKERLSVTLQNLGEAVVSTDVQGKIILLNERAEVLLGYKERELLGRALSKVWTLSSVNNKKIEVDPIAFVLKEVRPYQPSGAVQLRTGNVAGITIEFNCSPLFDATGRLIGTVVIFRDITDKRKLEEELLKARKLESLGILAGGLAHDFNNILTAIIGNISLASFLLEGKNEKKVSDLLMKAEKSSMRAQGLTQQLLTFSKGGAPVKKTASLKELVESSVEFALHGSSTTYTMDFAKDVRAVEIDEGQINQALNNLTINAMQAMPAGGEIQISAKNETIDETTSLPLAAGKYVKLIVADSGVGIKAEHLQRIFDPYFSTKQKGSGLGLATTYAIINKHGGLITVDSKLGEGTAFTIYLPATEKNIGKKPLKQEYNFRGSGHIIVMDDEADVRELVANILESNGYTVETCADGQELLAKYKKLKRTKESYDLALMDLTVPGGMGGKEAIKQLLKIQPKAQAIVSSGYSNDPIMANYKDYGFAGVIAKPYNTAGLLRLVKTLLSETLGTTD